MTLSSHCPFGGRSDQASLDDDRNLEEKRLLWKLPDVSEAGGELWMCMMAWRSSVGEAYLN